jgi:hypothetical protein
MSEEPLNFQTEQERREWIITHASYFTTARMIQRKYERQQWPSLDVARSEAKKLLKLNPKPVLIYAVEGIHDTFVEMVKL